MQLLLETNYLPNEFTIDALITFEDQFMQTFFGQDRTAYPYDCYPVKIAPDYNRGGQLDIAIVCQNRMWVSPFLSVAWRLCLLVSI